MEHLFQIPGWAMLYPCVRGVLGFHTFPGVAEGQLQNVLLAKTRQVSGLSRDVRKFQG